MKTPTCSRWIVMVSVAMLIVAGGCGKNGDDASDGSGSEVATSAIGGSASRSEASVALNQPRPADTYYARLLNELLHSISSPISSAWAVPSCSWSSLLSSCSSNSETLTFSGCSAPSDPAIKISGSETFAWTGSGCCTSTPLSASSTTPCSFVRRTITAAGASDPLVRSVGANSMTLSTEDTSGFDQSKTGGFTVTCQGDGTTNTCDGQRQVSMQGAHYSGQSGRAQWDHTVSTDTGLVIQGHDSSRKVLSGSVRVQHNLAKFTSITTVTTTLTHSAGCCFPTGGSVTTTFVGGKLDGKSETLSYGPGCGASTLTDSKQQQTGLTLHHCL